MARLLNTWFTKAAVDPRSNPKTWPINELFAMQVAAARKLLGTTKARLGVDINGPWVPFPDLPHARMSVFIKVDQFTWFDFRLQRSGRYGSDEYLTPFFTVDFQVAEPKESRGGQVPGRPYLHDHMEITFPANYPWSPPLFRLPSYSHLSASHEHHIYNDGLLCILADSSDWHGNRDNVASGLPVAFDWKVWQEELFGRRRGRWHAW